MSFTTFHNSQSNAIVVNTPVVVVTTSNHLGVVYAGSSTSTSTSTSNNSTSSTNADDSNTIMTTDSRNQTDVTTESNHETLQEEKNESTSLSLSTTNTATNTNTTTMTETLIILSSSSSPPPPPHGGSSSSISRSLWKLLRIVICDVPLLFLFTFFLLMMGLQTMYDMYYVPLIHRAQRTNVQLLQEYTYYDRQCTAYDISTHNIQDLLLVVDDDDDVTTQPPDHHDVTITNHHHKKKKKIVHRTVQQMLQHGAVVIPHLLSINTTQSLRRYIVQKNARITQDEVYPMSQGYQRLSYGIDAAEHIHVSTAIQQIVHHPVLRPLLTELLGDDDPASAEITAIMNYYGATHQVWHQDTKQDGNAIKFARTYSHSYSLFVPLQDITASMGPTDICPGTQYCTNDLETMCEAHKMGLHQVTLNTTTTATTTSHPSNDKATAVFPAGYGALLNQHVWHRGGAHVDEHAPERIMFIVSFVARPFTTLDDQRQLSRGTYFHQKWNMWGHTMYDLTNPMVYMKYPYSIFRCLSLYKSRTAHWGYDLITATYMRFANGQLEDPDLADRFVPSLVRYGVPSFLHGRILDHHDVDDDDNDQPLTQSQLWTTFIEETIQNIYDFVFTWNMYAHGIYFGILFLVAMTISILNRSKNNRFQWLYNIFVRQGIQRTLWTHGIVTLMMLFGWYTIQSSEWSLNVLAGRILQRPFPNMATTQSPPPLLSNKPIRLGENATILPATTNSVTSVVNHVPFLLRKTIPNGYTTIPTRYDILFGTRYDAPFLGSYNQWLQYHPGNQIYYQIIDQYRPSFQQLYWYTPINETTIVMSIPFIIDQIVQDVQQQTMRQGRFLQQNWATGDWHIVTPRMRMDQMIQDDLKLSVNHPLRTRINDQIAYHRFGPYRDTKLSQQLHLQLYTLRERLLYVNTTTTKTTMSTSTGMMNTDPTTVVPPASNDSILNNIRKRIVVRPTTMTKHRDSRSRRLLMQPWKRYSSSLGIADVSIPETFDKGTLIWYNDVDSEEWIPGIVMQVYYDQMVSDDDDTDLDKDTVMYDITTDDGSWYYNVLPEQLYTYRSVTTNDVVYGCFEQGLNDCYSGTVLHVYVSGHIRILYDDDDIYDHVPPSMYYIPPYRYEGPYQS